MSNTEFSIGSKAEKSGLQPLVVRGVYPEADIFLLQQVGPRHGVLVEIIARAGQPYTVFVKDESKTGLREGIHTVVIPDENAYIQLTKTGEGGLSKFWSEFRNEVAKLKQESKAPPETTQ